MLAVNCDRLFLDEQQLYRVKVLCKLLDSWRNILKLLIYKNLVNYGIIPLRFKLSKLQGNKDEVLSKEEEKEKEKKEKKKVTPYL